MKKIKCNHCLKTLNPTIIYCIVNQYCSIHRRFVQITATRRFPLALFCIVTASVRTVNASVMVHGPVRKLLATYLGIDTLPSKVGALKKK